MEIGFWQLFYDKKLPTSGEIDSVIARGRRNGYSYSAKVQVIVAQFSILTFQFLEVPTMRNLVVFQQEGSGKSKYRML